MTAGVLLVLTACTPGDDDSAPTAAPPAPLSQAPSQPPPLGLTDLTLTCERRNQRSADGTLRGKVVGLTSTAPHTVSVVQGIDATLGSVALSPTDATGSVAFAVPIARVHTEAPVRVVLRQTGVRSLSALVEVTPDAATCA